MFKRYYIIIICLLSVLSCDFFKSQDNRIPIARVGDNYLYKEEINNIIHEGTTLEDSTLLVNSFINRWALQLLLIDGAKLNLSETKQNDYNQLVEQYKNDLYTKAYLDALVKKNIDTIIKKNEAEDVYNSNQETFKLNEELIKFRYINISQNAINEDEIKERFKRFNNEDKTYLDSISVQFKNYSLNDSIWIKFSQVSSKISAVTIKNKKELLKKSNFVQLKDSIDLYLIQINDVLLQNDFAPLEYVKSTIDQIVINKRKLELIKQLQNDITKDAIKNNKFEIFN